jgi:DNA-binding response OmpR family regulator
MVTGLADVADRAKEAGAADFFTKPFKLRELIARVRSLLPQKW